MRKWTVELLQIEVDKHKTRNDFNKNNHAAYNAAKRLSCLNELFINKKNNGYLTTGSGSSVWTTENITELAKKYKTRGKLHKYNPSAYNHAHIRGILDLIFKDLPNKGYLVNHEFSDLRCIYAYEIIELNTVYVGLTSDIKRRDRDHLFSEKECLYKLIKEKGVSFPKPKILEEKLDSETARLREGYWCDKYKNNGWDILNKAKTGGLGGSVKKWTNKRLQDEANKYKTRGEFSIKSPNAASVASRRKLIDKLFINHPNNGYNENSKICGFWTFDECLLSASKYSSNKEWRDNEPGAYNSSIKNKWLNECRKHMKVCKNSGYWTLDLCLEESKKYQTPSDWSKNSSGSYSVAHKHGWIDKCISHMNKKKIWTKEECIKISKKYNKKIEWLRDDKNSYQAAHLHGWLIECCEHMIKNKMVDSEKPI